MQFESTFLGQSSSASPSNLKSSERYAMRKKGVLVACATPLGTHQHRSSKHQSSSPKHPQHPTVDLLAEQNNLPLRHDLNQRNPIEMARNQSLIQSNLKMNSNEYKRAAAAGNDAIVRWSENKSNPSPTAPTAVPAQHFRDSLNKASPIDQITTTLPPSIACINDNLVDCDDKAIKATIAIQKSWRMYRSQILSQKRNLSFSIFGLRYISAMTVQKWWRGYHTRKVLSQEASSLVICFPACPCEQTPSQINRKRNRRPPVFDINLEIRREALTKVMSLEIFAFERYLRGTPSSLNSCRRDDDWPSHRGGLSLSEVIPRSIVPLLISYAPFQFYDGIIYNNVHDTTWAQTYVRPNLPDECAFIENKVQPSMGLGSTYDGTKTSKGTAIGYCMRRPTCFKCGRRLSELAYWMGDESSRATDQDLKGSTMPVWKCPSMKVCGTFDALPWAKNYQLSYCSLRRCMFYSIPKTALIMAHSASRHLVAFASAKYLCSGYNEDLRVLYDSAIQGLLDAMLLKLNEFRGQPLIARHGHIHDSTTKKVGSLAIGLSNDDLRRQLESFINHRFGTRTLISVDFKFIKSKTSIDSRMGHDKEADWLINDSEYEHTKDPHSNVNNFVKLIV